MAHYSKTVEQFCQEHNLGIRLITYRCQGVVTRRKGIDIYRKSDNGILIKLEPRLHGWFIRENPAVPDGSRYVSRLNKHFFFYKAWIWKLRYHLIISHLEPHMNREELNKPPKFEVAKIKTSWYIWLFINHIKFIPWNTYLLVQPKPWLLQFST